MLFVAVKHVPIATAGDDAKLEGEGIGVCVTRYIIVFREEKEKKEKE